MEQDKPVSFQDRLRFYRDECSDEIPDEILNGNLSLDDPRRLYKVRRNWWQGLVGVLERGLRKGNVTDEEVEGEVRKFLEHYCSDAFKKQSRTTAMDILEVNRIITIVLGDNQVNSTL